MLSFLVVLFAFVFVFAYTFGFPLGMNAGVKKYALGWGGKFGANASYGGGEVLSSLGICEKELS